MLCNNQMFNAKMFSLSVRNLVIISNLICLPVPKRNKWNPEGTYQWLDNGHVSFNHLNQGSIVCSVGICLNDERELAQVQELVSQFSEWCRNMNIFHLTCSVQSQVQSTVSQAVSQNMYYYKSKDWTFQQILHNTSCGVIYKSDEQNTII